METSYEDLAFVFDSSFQENARLKQSLNSYVRENMQLRQQLDDFKSKAANQRRTLAGLQNVEAKHKTETVKLRKQIEQLTSTRMRMELEMAQLRSQLKSAKHEVYEKQECLKVQAALSAASHNHSDLPADVPQDFVVVLVDGDAYMWTDRFPITQDIGARVASSIQNRVLTYLKESKHTCKIITRIYQNCDVRGQPQALLADHLGIKTRTQSILSFNQSIPLFDYVDVGSGKERADGKIRANFDLYISNPYCRHIFLAACTDNGFARMIEPYLHTSAINKLTLVSGGHVVHDLAMLKLRTIVWPDVFKLQAENLSPADRAKRTAREGSIRRRNQQLGLLGTIDEEAARRIVHMVQTQESRPIAGTAKAVLEKLRQHRRVTRDAPFTDVKELIENVD